MATSPSLALAKVRRGPPPLCPRPSSLWGPPLLLLLLSNPMSAIAAGGREKSALCWGTRALAGSTTLTTLTTLTALASHAHRQSREQRVRTLRGTTKRVRGHNVLHPPIHTHLRLFTRPSLSLHAQPCLLCSHPHPPFFFFFFFFFFVFFFFFYLDRDGRRSTISGVGCGPVEACDLGPVDYARGWPCNCMCNGSCAVLGLETSADQHHRRSVEPEQAFAESRPDFGIVLPARRR